MSTNPFNPEFIRGQIATPEQQRLIDEAIQRILANADRDEARELLPELKAHAPVSLTGSAKVTPGATVAITTDSLRNPSKLPLAIHEIKFVSWTGATPVAAVTVNAGGGTVPPASSGALEVTIMLDDLVVTKTPVPMNLMGVRRTAAVEAIAIPDGTNIYGLASQTWRLDAPLVLRGGQALSVAIGHRGFYPYEVTAYATLSGRFLPTMPKTLQVPYVAAYVPTAFQPTTGTSDTLLRTSTERDLSNELIHTLRVKRFIGKISTIAAGMARVWDLVPMVNSQLVTVNMRSIAGVPTVRYDTPFENVFDVFSGAWECQHDLPPGAYWIANLKCARTTTAAAQAQPGIAMHAVREEVVS